MSSINDSALSHLFKLARMQEEQDPARREKLITDLSKILDYFKQLQTVHTDSVEPLAGGTDMFNAWREDEIVHRTAQQSATPESLRVSFPEHEQTHLKVPPVFE